MTFEGVVIRNDKQEATGKVDVALSVRVTPSANTTTATTISSSSAGGNVLGPVALLSNQPLVTPSLPAAATGTGTSAATTTAPNVGIPSGSNAARPVASADNATLAPPPVISTAAAPSLVESQSGLQPGQGLGPPLETAKQVNIDNNNNGSTTADEDGKAADEFFENYEGDGDGYDQVHLSPLLTYMSSLWWPFAPLIISPLLSFPIRIPIFYFHDKHP